MLRFRPVLFLVVLLSFPSHADGKTHQWYLGAAVGATQIEDYESNSVRHDFIIGWRPWRYLGFEGSYINLGRFKDPGAPDPILRVNGFGGAALGIIPITDRYTILAGYGLHKLDIETGYEGYEPALARIVSLGAETTLTQSVVARIAVQAIYGITDRHAHGKYQAVGGVMGLFYRF